MIYVALPSRSHRRLKTQLNAAPLQVACNDRYMNVRVASVTASVQEPVVRVVADLELQLTIRSPKSCRQYIGTALDNRLQTRRDGWKITTSSKQRAIDAERLTKRFPSMTPNFLRLWYQSQQFDRDDDAYQEYTEPAWDSWY